MNFIILGARDQDIHNKREDYTAIRRSISQIQNDLTVFMKVQSFRGAHGPLAPLAPCPACIPFKGQPYIPPSQPSPVAHLLYHLNRLLDTSTTGTRCRRTRLGSSVGDDGPDETRGLDLHHRCHCYRRMFQELATCRAVL